MKGTPNATRRWKRRRAERLVCPGVDRSKRPAHGTDAMKEPGLPPPTRRMLRLGIDRASMAQGGRPREGR